VDGPTIFTTDKDILINGKKLPAGSYSLFVKPEKDSWTFAFNSDTHLKADAKSETLNPDPAKNVITVTVKPEKVSKFNNYLSYNIANKGINLQWADALAPLTIQSTASM
jgi:hypothetical protein